MVFPEVVPLVDSSFIGSLEILLDELLRDLLFLSIDNEIYDNTGRERLIRSHSSARFYFKLSGNSNYRA